MADDLTPRSGDQQEDGLDLGSMFPVREKDIEWIMLSLSPI
jgi:hypothetical protein